MKAIINGIEVSGTPEEIFRYKQLETRAEAEVLKTFRAEHMLKIDSQNIRALVDGVCKEMGKEMQRMSTFVKRHETL